jgi:hypothetical protein
MDHFFKFSENHTKEKLAITGGIYKLLRERLLKLSEVNEEQYARLIDNPLINNKIERFIELENRFYSPEEIENNQNYRDLEQSTAQEVDA